MDGSLANVQVLLSFILSFEALVSRVWEAERRLLSHFKDEKTEVPRGNGTSQRSPI